MNPPHLYEYQFLGCYILIEAIEFEITLKVGITLPQIGQQATRENIIQTAQEAEKEDIDSLIQTTNEAQRFPLTGTIDQAGNDIQRIKQMGIDHIIFGYNFIPVGRNLEKMMDITKRLSKFAR